MLANVRDRLDIVPNWIAFRGRGQLRNQLVLFQVNEPRGEVAELRAKAGSLFSGGRFKRLETADAGRLTF